MSNTVKVPAANIISLADYLRTRDNLDNVKVYFDNGHAYVVRAERFFHSWMAETSWEPTP